MLIDTGQLTPELAETLGKEFGDTIAFATSVGDGLEAQLAGKHFRHILEIGTMHGLSAVVLAAHADKVTTVDIEHRPVTDEVLKAAGVFDRVEQVIVKDDAEKERVVAQLWYDMAFVDAAHSRIGVLTDFAIVKVCGSVLFHDYPSVPERSSPETYLWQRYGWAWDHADGIGFLLDVIRPEGKIIRCAPFAWWLSEEAARAETLDLR